MLINLGIWYIKKYMRIAYKFISHYHTLSAYKNLSPQQCSVFAQLVFDSHHLDEK